MGVIREVLFGKVDLDMLTTALVLGLSPSEVVFRQIAGSATGGALSDPSIITIETGGTGRTTENNFDHHGPKLFGGSNLAACAQALRRLARLVDYVDELDRGVRRTEQCEGNTFPSLAQLVSGMMLVIKDDQQRLKWGLEILKAVVQSGVDPYAGMEPILDSIPHARWWVAQKRFHDEQFEIVCQAATWHTTKGGKKLAVVETTWFGAPGALYGRGAEIVVALNPEHEIKTKKIRKFTIAGHGIVVASAAEKLNERELGWGGPVHGTIIGSNQQKNSELTLEEVKNLIIEMF